MIEEVLWQLTMDSDSDMEPEDDDFLQDLMILSLKVAMKPC